MAPAGVAFVISPSAITAVGAVFPALCIIIVGLRLYTRRLQDARLELDDWFAIAALVRLRRLFPLAEAQDWPADLG